MPETRYYTVTQEREVKVSANSPGDAIRVAELAFKGEMSKSSDVVGNVQSPVRDREISAREDF
jgi:hypothetical protein